MKKDIINFLLLSGLIFIPLNKSFAIINKGETDKGSPLFLFQKIDTISKRSFEKAKSFFNKKEYSKALDISLVILDEARRKNDIELEYLSSFLIGDSFMKMNNHDKALAYFKSSLKI